MWIKLARNPFWLVFCVVCSIVSFFSDVALREAWHEESVYGVTSGKTPLKEGGYIIPARWREHGPLFQSGDGIYRTPMPTKLIVSALEFPPLSSVRTAPDSVIVARVRHRSTIYNRVSYDNEPEFTVFVPQYMTKYTIVVTAYDAGDHPHSTVKADDFVTASKVDGMVRAMYVCPRFSTPSVRRVEVTFLP